MSSTTSNRPKIEVPLFRVFMSPEGDLLPRLRQVLYSGQITEGAEVTAFERAFGEFTAAPNVISFYCGTAALHTALILAGVRPGDEVVSTPVTAEPSNMAIRHAGARIVWADVDPRNGNLTGESIAAKITERTRAILVVHYGGVPAPLNAIRNVAKEHGVPVIEDAAHALGARYDGNMIGSHSEFVMFSFQAIKHMTTVDGGMLSCGNSDDLDRGRLIRWFGIDRQAPRVDLDVAEVGYKYHMNNVNAAIGLVQLQHIRPVIDRHIANGRFYDRALEGIPGVDLCTWDRTAEPAYWFYTVLVDSRDDFVRHLLANGIGASQIHKRNDRHSVFAASRCDLPGVDSFYDRMVHIPCGWWVSDEDRERVVDVIERGW